MSMPPACQLCNGDAGLCLLLYPGLRGGEAGWTAEAGPVTDGWALLREPCPLEGRDGGWPVSQCFLHHSEQPREWAYTDTCVLSVGPHTQALP